MINHPEQYLSQADDYPNWAPGERVPYQAYGNQVEAFIDGTTYFSAIDAEITSLLGDPGANPYFYITAWSLGLAAVNKKIEVCVGDRTATALAELVPGLTPQWECKLDVSGIVLPQSNELLLLRLVALAEKGVDVRVLAWTSPFAPKYKEVADKTDGIVQDNLHTIISVDTLRGMVGKNLADRVMLNTVAHPLASAHLKLVVCGNDSRMCAYTGGLDPQQNRLKAPDGQPEGGWHDVAVRVQGPSAGGMYDFFAELWNEQRTRLVESFYLGGREIPSHSATAPVLQKREAVAVKNVPLHTVQVLRTVPQMCFSLGGPEQFISNPIDRFVMSKAVGFQRLPLTFAPNGIFEYKVALRKAISRAQDYVFIADQCFWSFEVMDWLNDRVKQAPNLKVILLYGPDPKDPPTGIMRKAIDDHLYPGLTVDQLSIWRWKSTAVHCKVVIVDDMWCTVGSANCARRSLYSDIELSVGIADPAFVRPFRAALWAHYCGLPPQSPALLDLRAALGIWKKKWGAAPGGVQLRTTIVGLEDPTAQFNQLVQDLLDVDSRMTF